MNKIRLFALCTCMAGLAGADTIFSGGDMAVAANWDNGIPNAAGDTNGIVNVDGTIPSGNQSVDTFSGSTITLGGGAVISTPQDLPAGNTTWVVNDATLNLGDDLFSNTSDITLNAGSAVNADDLLEAQSTGTLTINGGTHTAGGSFGFQGAAPHDGTLNFFGGKVTAGTFRFDAGDQNSSMNLGGTATATATGATTADKIDGTVNVSPDWTGSLTAENFSGTAWKDAVLAADWYLDGVPVDSTVFDANFAVSPDGKTLTDINTPDNLPQFIEDPVVKSSATYGTDYVSEAQTLAGSATNTVGDTMSYEKVGGPEWLVVATNGDLSGTPTATGTNSFAIKAITGDFSSQGTLLIVVDPLGSAPEFTTNPVVTADGLFNADYALQSQSLTNSATDVDGDMLTYSKVDGPAWLDIAPNGALSGVCDVAGTNSFTIMVDDGNDNTDSATLVIYVGSPGNPPEFTIDPISTADGEIDFDYALESQTLEGTATDPDGDSLTYSKAAGPAWLVVATNGALSGVCDSRGTNTFTVAVDDGNGNSDTATLLIYVKSAPEKLLHLWTFDEGTGDVAADSAGSSDGVLLNATWASDGDRSSYISFNGTDSVVNPSVTMALPTAGNAETWACWVLNPSSATNNNDVIIGNRGIGAADFGKFTARDNGRFAYRQDGRLIGESFGGIVQDSWTHLAFVREGADAVFYVNGEAAGTGVLPLDNASALQFFVGGEPGVPATEHFEGGIDDVVLYNYALSPENVVDVMNGIYDFGPVDLDSEITAYSFDPAGTSSLSFQGAASSAYVIKSTDNLQFSAFTNITPTAVTVGSLAGDVITTDGSGKATAEFIEAAPAKFYKVESAP